MLAPPGTEPVKATKSTSSEAMILAVASWDRCSTWNTPSGRPASAKASAMRSPQRGVWLACFRMTVLPAMIAGMIELTAVR